MTATAAKRPLLCEDDNEVVTRTRLRSRLQTIADFQCPAFLPLDRQITQVSLTGLMPPLGGPLCLFFYGSDFSPEAERAIWQINTEISTLLNLGAHVVAISTDSVYVHGAFATRLTWPPTYPLLSDTTRLIAHAFGVADPSSGTCRRAAVVLDGERQLRLSLILGRNEENYPMKRIVHTILELARAETE
ncbi:thioredoxin-like protein [Syncephalastrum racemosum]|uniref:Thioredoxin-like protein n=1 Tax=Syncephalastrum racemosum TaxID=13706 RepID=A0A1X2HLC0_SYNRA|nr:thioredoxin-like protein [Syncephalastrum racemosum]